MYIVLNLGLKSIRSVVFNGDGKIISSCSLPLATFLDGPRVEQDATEWWEKGQKVVKESIGQIQDGGQIDYITVTASSSCLVAVDRNGLPLGKVMMVSDTRAKEEALIIDSLKSFQNIRGAGLLNNSTLMVPKMLWLKKHHPGIYGSCSYLLSPNDYFCLRMTGEAKTDVLNAQKSLFVKADNAFARTVFDDLNLDMKKLPDVVNVGEIVGDVSCDAKAAFGIKGAKKTKYVVTTYDAVCAFYGSGLLKEGDACDVSGTVTSLRALSRGEKVLNTDKVLSQYIPSNDISIIGGSNNLGGGLIEWCKQALYEDIKNPYGLMEAEARGVKDGLDGLIFLPYLMGERAPLWNENARGVYFGLGRHHRRPHMSRSVFESAGFCLKSLSENVEHYSGIDITSIRVSGGLSRIHLINQIKADICNKEIIVLNEFETTSIGGFILMMMSLGKIKSLESASKLVKVREVIYPNQECVEKYAVRYQLFKSVYESLRPEFDNLAKLYQNDVYKITQKIENL